MFRRDISCNNQKLGGPHMYLPANDAIGKLILRLTVGLLLLPHGIAKLIRGVDGIGRRMIPAGMAGNAGLIVARPMVAGGSRRLHRV